MEKALVKVVALAALALCVSAHPATELPKSAAEETCQALLSTMPSCLGDIISSFMRWNVHLGHSCCLVLEGFSDACFRTAFPSLPPSPFKQLIHDFCLTNGHVLH